MSTDKSAPAADPVAGVPPARWRIVTARLLGIAGLAAYNWWVGVVLWGHRLSSPDELLSDLEAAGRPGASTLDHLDLVAGVLLLVALLTRGPSGRQGRRPEWPLLVLFAVAGGLGGAFPYVCPEGLSAACRSAEWQLALPGRHYLHVAAGVVEMVAATLAIVVAARRSTGRPAVVAYVARVLRAVMLAGWPLLALAYLTDRLGAVVEPVFFVAFSTMMLVELFEPAG